MKPDFKYLPVHCLERGRYQPRQTFNEEALRELAQSILTQGLLEPLVVRAIAPHRYEIIAGERRWRAALLAKLTDVPCVIGTYSDEQTAAISIIENIQREALNLIEEARSYQRLQTEFGYTQETIADLIGKSRSHIANILRLLTLCPLVQTYLQTEQLTLGHARLLVGLSPTEQKAWAICIQEEGWSVRKLEQEIRLQKQSKQPPLPDQSSPDLSSLETTLAEQVGAPVSIVLENDKGGWLKIKFFDNDTFEGLLERMGLRYD